MDAGAAEAFQISSCTPGTPASARLGTSGSSGLLPVEVTPIARSLPTRCGAGVCTQAALPRPHQAGEHDQGGYRAATMTARRVVAGGHAKSPVGWARKAQRDIISIA